MSEVSGIRHNKLDQRFLLRYKIDRYTNRCCGRMHCYGEKIGARMWKLTALLIRHQTTILMVIITWKRRSEQDFAANIKHGIVLTDMILTKRMEVQPPHTNGTLKVISLRNDEPVYVCMKH